MEPEVRYCCTDDGVNIAYWAMGSGPPLVIMTLPYSNVQFELQSDGRTGLEATARAATVVRYDHRGFGLSDKHEAEFTTEEFVRDLEAVVDKLGLEKFFIFAGVSSYPIALEYAKLHPERVLRIVAQLERFPVGFIEGILDAAGSDWQFLTEAITLRILGWSDEAAGRRAAHLRASTDEPGYRRFVRWLFASWPVRGLRDVQAPCLFLPWGGSGESDSVADARQMAGQMPNGSVHVMLATNSQDFGRETNSAVTSFFTQGLPARPPRPPKPSTSASGTAVILFTDIADSTSLTERLGDAVFRTASRALDAATRGAIRAAGGAPVEGKVLGDGVMGVFTSATQAIDAARRCVAASAESELRLHIGLHAGDVIREDDNVYGGAVNIASRICGLCEPGEILVSATVRDLARTSAGAVFEDRGEHALKGIAESVRVFAVSANN
jgi:class 3 adenylate cyclase